MPPFTPPESPLTPEDRSTPRKRIRRAYRAALAADARPNPTPGLGRAERRRAQGPRPTDVAFTVHHGTRLPTARSRASRLSYAGKMDNSGQPVVKVLPPVSGQGRRNYKRSLREAFWQEWTWRSYGPNLAAAAAPA